MCVKYWPDEEYTYNKIRVVLLSEIVNPSFVERTFEIKYTNSYNVALVKQHSFTLWRGSVPDQAAFIDFIYYTRFLTKNTLEPLAIHSA